MPSKDEKESNSSSMSAGATSKSTGDDSNTTASKDKKDKKDAVDDDTSAEDRKLRETLDKYVEAVLTPYSNDGTQSLDAYNESQKQALEGIRKEIRSATATMTAIPKPLKFLRPYFDGMKAFFDDPLLLSPVSPNRAMFADVLSVLAMTGPREAREVLKYRLLGSQDEPLHIWGLEYLRALAGELGGEYRYRTEDEDDDEEGDIFEQKGGDMTDVPVKEERGPRDRDVTVIINMAHEIVKYYFDHANEYEAVDLLMEVEQLPKVLSYIKADNCKRVGAYLLACSRYSGTPEDAASIVGVVFDCYTQCEMYANAVLAALRLPEPEEFVRKAFDAAAPKGDEAILVQMGYILSVQKVFYPWIADEFDVAAAPAGNANLSAIYHDLAAEMGVVDPKSPADIYKTHLEDGRSARVPRASSVGAPTVDSALENLASTFVSAFVNVGFGHDTLLVQKEGAAASTTTATSSSRGDWIYNLRGAGKLSAAAAVGLVKLWDVEEGFNAVDKYFVSSDVNIKGGACLASGIVSSGVTSEMNASFALLSEQLENPDATKEQLVGSLLGLGLSYCHTANSDVQELILPILVDGERHFDVTAAAGLALGLVFAGSNNNDVAGAIVDTILSRGPEQAGAKSDLDKPIAKLLSIGLGLVFVGIGTAPAHAIEMLGAIEHQISTYTESVITTFAAAGTGDVSQLQHLLRVCSERVYTEEDDDADEGTPTPPASTAQSSSSSSAAAGAGAGTGAAGESASSPKNEEKKDEASKPKGLLRHLHQGSSVLGLAAISLGEGLASQMCVRALDHVLQCGENNTRRAVPLALGLLSISNPQLPVMDTLLKLAHEQDRILSMNAVLSLGLLGAGSNNARIAQILRDLAAYFSKEPQHLFCVRIAQGLLHLGKGLCTLSPVSFDASLIVRPSLAAILAFSHIALDLTRMFFQDDREYLLFTLVPAIRPRFLYTIDADADFAKVSAGVRVGQAVDIVGQPGNPRALTGFQTHKAPVLMAVGERAELATDEWNALTDCLDGVVVLRANPDAVHVAKD